MRELGERERWRRRGGEGAEGAEEMDSRGVDVNVAQFVEQQEERAQVQGVLLQITDVCWDKCMKDTGKEVTAEQKQCIQNCTERFLDTSIFVVNRVMKRRK